MFKTTEIELDVAGQKIAALKSVSGSKHKILCLHGWLDNANSFKPLLPLINSAEIIAVDLPGHGYSEHQPCTYSMAAQSHTALATADALGWDKFSFIGHSLGGCIAPFATVAAGDRIEKLVLIEAAGPRSEPAESLPDRLTQFHKDMGRPEKYRSRFFDSIDQAIESRLRANKMSHESARLIVERQLKQIDHNGSTKWQWRFDSKLRIASPGYYTEEQIQSILKKMPCPTLCILADKGYLADRTETAERLACIPELSAVTHKGHHHLHLDNPPPVAESINEFLNL